MKTQPDSMSQNARKGLPRNFGTPTDTPPSTLVVNSRGLNPSPKRAVRDPKTGRGNELMMGSVLVLTTTTSEVLLLGRQTEAGFYFYFFLVLQLFRRETHTQSACGRE